MSEKYYQAANYEPVDLIRGLEDHKVLTVLQALFWGFEVKLGDIKYRLANNVKGGVCPVLIVGEKQNQVMGAPDLSLECLSNMATQMSEQDFQNLKLELNCSKSLTKFKQEPKTIVRQ